MVTAHPVMLVIAQMVAHLRLIVAVIVGEMWHGTQEDPKPRGAITHSHADPTGWD